MTLTNTSTRYLLVTLLIFSGLVALQLPFLKADADLTLSWSRGPFTDEGLYTSQVRNALITGRLDLEESVGVMKEPLFSALEWLALRTFGDTMVVGRLAVMLLASLVLALLAGGASPFAWAVRIGIIVAGLGYFVFNYSHLAMAEVLSAVTVLAGLRLLFDRLQGAGGWTLVLAGLLMFLAYALKFQYVYVALVPALAFAIALVLDRFSGADRQARLASDLIASLVVAGGFAALYYAAWVAPLTEVFDRLVMNEVWSRAGQSPGGADTLHVIAGNLRAIGLDYRNWPLLLPIPLALVLGVRGWTRSADEPSQRRQLIALLAPPTAWLLVELHKLALGYLPSRYLVPLYLALAMTCAAAMVGGWLSGQHRPLRVVRVLGVSVLVAVLAANLGFYVSAALGRTFQIHNAQTTFAADGRWRRRVVMGQWAPSLFWGTGAITLPIAPDRDHAILARFRPTGLVAEVNQTDGSDASAATFARDGIDLRALAAEAYLVRVAYWDIGVFRLHED